MFFLGLLVVAFARFRFVCLFDSAVCLIRVIVDGVIHRGAVLNLFELLYLSGEIKVQAFLNTRCHQLSKGMVFQEFPK